MKKVLVILGPTATGKTDLALLLAKKFNGELISCDSRQVYQGLDIGTGKMPGEDLRFTKYDLRWEIDGVNVWMYDVVEPKVRYTVKEYVEQANREIEDIIQRGKLPIIVGGTGFYIKALLEGIPSLEVPVNEDLRGELEKLALEELQEKLQALSPTRFDNLNDSDKKNPRRLLRSIELVIMNPNKRTSKNQEFRIKNLEFLKIGLTAPREVLQSRIYNRLISRIDQGLITEGERLHREGLGFQRMEELGLEYGMMAQLLGGKISENQFIDQLSVKIFQYAKRQMTWFKKDPDIDWFNIIKEGFSDLVEKKVASWYDLGNDSKN